jgi:hypothetical protein
MLLGSDDSTSQLRVRGAFVILLAFSALAHQFGVDALLGAFIGGIVLNIADRDDRPNHPAPGQTGTSTAGAVDSHGPLPETPASHFRSAFVTDLSCREYFFRAPVRTRAKCQRP